MANRDHVKHTKLLEDLLLAISTAANQILANASLASIDGKVSTAAKQDAVIANLQTINSLVPDAYDYIFLGYTGSDLTSVVFKMGGAGGSTVSTLTLAYSSSVLQSVTRT